MSGDRNTQGTGSGAGTGTGSGGAGSGTGGGGAGTGPRKQQARGFKVDTADRVRVSDLIRLDDQTLLVEDVTDAQTLNHPSRLALHVADPHSSWATNPRVVHVYAGETVTFRPGSAHLMGPTGLRPGGVEFAETYAGRAA